MMRERASSIASRVCSPGQSGVADISDFNLLQTLNRLHPGFEHLARKSNPHPEQLYTALAQACGELATFTDEGRLPMQCPPYQHDNLSESLRHLQAAMRRALGTVLQPRAVSLEILAHAYGVHTASVPDMRLLEDADFILAINANMPAEELRRRFAQQAKVSSIENLNERVRLHLPGIPLVPLPVAPRQLPFHAGFSYFELDRRDTVWNSLKNSSGFGLHVAGDFPELTLQLWAIRRSQ
jgi:type VI secretion system protein ImpJ